jgi:chromosome segregation ATPase
VLLHSVKWRKRHALLAAAFSTFHPRVRESARLRQVLETSLLRQRRRRGVDQALTIWTCASLPFASEASTLVLNRLATTLYKQRARMRQMRVMSRWSEVARESLLKRVASKTMATARSAQAMDRDAEEMRQRHRKQVDRLQQELQEQQEQLQARGAEKSELLLRLERETEDACRMRRQLEEAQNSAQACTTRVLGACCVARYASLMMA